MAMDMEMDLVGGGGGGGVAAHARTRTPDSDTDTPPRNPPFKRLHHSNAPHAPCVSYKECMKNHAATIGGHALDGCCEFMPGPAFNPFDPTSLKCGACGCHRNFHRRDPDDPTPLNHHPTPARVPHSPPSASQLLLSLSQSPSGPSDEVNPTAVLFAGQNGNFTSSGSGNSRKRFRTKFTQEQKEKMHEFSEKIGWKLKKGDEKLIEEFVKEIGVGRSVFKVWMHNNKHTSVSVPKTPGTKVELAPDGFKTVRPNNNINNNNYPTQQQPDTSSNGSNKSNNNNNVGNNNCGASAFDNHNHNHHRQFNFGNGTSHEAAQAQ